MALVELDSDWRVALTQCEFNCVNLMVTGMSNQQIADTLGCNIAYVRNNLSVAYSKFGIEGGKAQMARANLARIVLVTGMVKAPSLRSFDFNIDSEHIDIYASYPLDPTKFSRVTLSNDDLTQWFLIYNGLTDGEIARRMHYSISSIRTRGESLYNTFRNGGLMKCDNGRVGVVRVMFQSGLYRLAEKRLNY